MFRCANSLRLLGRVGPSRTVVLVQQCFYTFRLHDSSRRISYLKGYTVCFRSYCPVVTKVRRDCVCARARARVRRTAEREHSACRCRTLLSRIFSLSSRSLILCRNKIYSFSGSLERCLLLAKICLIWFIPRSRCSCSPPLSSNQGVNLSRVTPRQARQPRSWARAADGGEGSPLPGPPTMAPVVSYKEREGGGQ
jgi:hypothetical protein